MQYLKLTFLTLLAFIYGLAGAQTTKTLDGIIADQKGTPLKELKVTLNTPTAESTNTDENGYYFLSTQDFPTGITDIAKVKEALKIYPNPARDHATLNVPNIEGKVTLYNELGQELGETNITQEQDLSFTSNRLVLLRYTNNKGQTQTTKLLLQGKNNIKLHIQKENEYEGNQTKKRKNAKIEDTFGYKLTLTSNNIKDTIIDIINFYKDQLSHNQNITVNSKPQIINENYQGETFTDDTLKIGLATLRYTDDNDNPSIIQGTNIAKLRNDSILIYDSGNIQLNFNDGENEPVTSQVMQFIKQNYKKLTVNAENEQTNQKINNARIIIDNLEGKLDTTYTNENGQAQLNIKPGTLYVMKIEKTGYTGWVQELSSEKDTTINKQLMQDEEHTTTTGIQVQLIDIFNDGWRSQYNHVRKPDYNKQWTHLVKTTDDDDSTQLAQRYIDYLFKYISILETEIQNIPTLCTEQKAQLNKFITRMDTVYINELPSDWTTKDALYSAYSKNMPGTGDVGFSQDAQWNIINSIVRIEKSIGQYEDDYQMQRTTGQEDCSFIFGATDPVVLATPQTSILQEGNLVTEPTPLDYKLFEHAMNTPTGTSYKAGVEIAPISTAAEQSILVPTNYDQKLQFNNTTNRFE